MNFLIGPGKYNPPYLPSKEPKAPAYSISPRREPEKGLIFIVYDSSSAQLKNTDFII